MSRMLFSSGRGVWAKGANINISIFWHKGKNQYFDIMAVGRKPIFRYYGIRAKTNISISSEPIFQYCGIRCKNQYFNLSISRFCVFSKFQSFNPVSPRLKYFNLASPGKPPAKGRKRADATHQGGESLPTKGESAQKLPKK